MVYALNLNFWLGLDQDSQSRQFKNRCLNYQESLNSSKNRCLDMSRSLDLDLDWSRLSRPQSLVLILIAKKREWLDNNFLQVMLFQLRERNGIIYFYITFYIWIMKFFDFFRLFWLAS